MTKGDLLIKQRRIYLLKILVLVYRGSKRGKLMRDDLWIYSLRAAHFQAAGVNLLHRNKNCAIKATLSWQKSPNATVAGYPDLTSTQTAHFDWSRYPESGLRLYWMISSSLKIWNTHFFVLSQRFLSHLMENISQFKWIFRIDYFLKRRIFIEM